MVNGSCLWTADCGGGVCTRAQPITIPKGRTSTVVVNAAGSAAYNWGYGNQVRKVMLAFYNNSLKLPTGLQFVDDFDTATGGWEQ